jgi:hypothetical protein
MWVCHVVACHIHDVWKYCVQGGAAVEDMPDRDAGPRSDLCADANPRYSQHAVNAAHHAAKELHGSLQRPAMLKVRVLEVLQPLGLHGVGVVSAGSGIRVSGAAWQTTPGVTHLQHNTQAAPDSTL